MIDSGLIAINVGRQGSCITVQALGALVLVLVLHICAVTVSSTGAENQFQGDDNGHVWCPCQVSPALPFPELL
jgi:hypothetical protein